MASEQVVITDSNTVLLQNNSTSERQLYEVSALYVCNDEAVDATMQLYFVKSGGTPTNGFAGNKIVPDFTIATKKSAVIEVYNIKLEKGDSLQAIADTTNILKATLWWNISQMPFSR